MESDALDALWQKDNPKSTQLKGKIVDFVMNGKPLEHADDLHIRLALTFECLINFWAPLAVLTEERLGSVEVLQTSVCCMRSFDRTQLNKLQSHIAGVNA